MINKKDAEKLKDMVYDKLWKHDEYFGYSTAMEIFCHEINKMTTQSKPKTQ